MHAAYLDGDRPEEARKTTLDAFLSVGGRALHD
jgi:hypothetical protein